MEWVEGKWGRLGGQCGLGRRCRCWCCTYRLREWYCGLCAGWSRGGQKGKIGWWIVTPAVPLPQPISTAPAPAPPAQPTSSSQPAPLAFNLFHTSYLPLYDVTDFYEHPQGYAQLQQPLRSPHRQPLPPSPDPDAEMSSPTHDNSSIDHYGLLQPPSPRDVPMGTPPSDHLPF